MSLKDRAAKAREAQTFNSPTTPQVEAPKPKPAEPRSSKRSPTKQKPKPTAKETANARARRSAGVEASAKLSRADQQALRRRELAQLSIELPEHRKAELLEAAADNGRTLKAEVLHRLFGQ